MLKFANFKTKDHTLEETGIAIISKDGNTREIDRTPDTPLFNLINLDKKRQKKGRNSNVKNISDIASYIKSVDSGYS